MSQFDVRNYDTLPKDKWLKRYGSVIERLLKEDGNDNETTVVSEPTVRDVMLQSLRNHISAKYNDHWSLVKEGHRYVIGACSIFSRQFVWRSISTSLFNS